MVAPASNSGSYRLRATLLDIKPEIWRSIVIPADFTLGELHTAIQISMGWSDSHLHRFELGNRAFEAIHDGFEPEPRVEDENAILLDSLGLSKGDSLFYEYDFGDGWRHEISVEAILDSDALFPLLENGARACPPEDSGGPFAYIELLEILSDPDHEEYESMTEWLGGFFDSEAFDAQAINKRLADVFRNRALSAPALPDPKRTRKKGPRECPGIGKTISPSECGSKRNSEILCPYSCPYNPLSEYNSDGFEIALERLLKKLVKTIQELGAEITFQQSLSLLAGAFNENSQPIAVLEAYHSFFSAVPEGDRGGFFDESKTNSDLLRKFNNDERLFLEMFVKSRLRILELGEGEDLIPCADPFNQASFTKLLVRPPVDSIWEAGDWVIGRFMEHGDRLYHVLDLMTVPNFQTLDFADWIDADLDELEKFDSQNLSMENYTTILDYGIDDDFAESDDAFDGIPNCARALRYTCAASQAAIGLSKLPEFEMLSEEDSLFSDAQFIVCVTGDHPVLLKTGAAESLDSDDILQIGSVHLNEELSELMVLAEETEYVEKIVSLIKAAIPCEEVPEKEAPF